MGGGLEAVLARLREHRRWIEYRRQAARASAGLDERDRANSAARPSAAASRDDGAQSPPGYPVRRRSLVSMGAAITLAAVAVAAISLGVSELSKGPQQGRPNAAVQPSGTVPGSALGAPSAIPVATSDHGLTAPPSVTTDLTGAVSGATSAATGSAADVAPASAAGTDTSATAASPSPSLLDLCRSVVAAGTSWPSVLKGTDRATVIAAAGKKNNVLAYCTALVDGGPTP